jgi:ABC-type glycerol-3-phosphate transport system substrate-binding protein
VSEASSAPESSEPALAKASITIASPWQTSVAFSALTESFMKKYPDCTIVYEPLQNYSTSVVTRLKSTDPEDEVNLFIAGNIQDNYNTNLMPYAYNLYSAPDQVDLSQCFPGLIQNFTYIDTQNPTSTDKIIYSVPLGGEVRGMAVNKTLLSHYSLSVPTKQSEFLSCCDTLSKANLYPLQGNPGNFGQFLMYPYVANQVANASDYQTVFAEVNERKTGCSEIFREPMAFLYSLVEKNYYNYKKVETDLGFFLDATTNTAARNFLNIIAGTDGTYSKKDDLGQIPFMPIAMSSMETIDQMKADYHSTIDYDFIVSPVGTEGGYAYLSPANGIAVNKNSASLKLAWSLRFLNYLFRAENNKTFATKMNILPNTTDVFDTIKTRFSIPENHISQLGTVTFAYDFFSIMKSQLAAVSKGNNPKYMQTDESGNTTMYPLSYYMTSLENALTGKN